MKGALRRHAINLSCGSTHHTASVDVGSANETYLPREEVVWHHCDTDRNLLWYRGLDYLVCVVKSSE